MLGTAAARWQDRRGPWQVERTKQSTAWSLTVHSSARSLAVPDPAGRRAAGHVGRHGYLGRLRAGGRVCVCVQDSAVRAVIQMRWARTHCLSCALLSVGGRGRMRTAPGQHALSAHAGPVGPSKSAQAQAQLSSGLRVFVTRSAAAHTCILHPHVSQITRKDQSTWQLHSLPYRPTVVLSGACKSRTACSSARARDATLRGRAASRAQRGRTGSCMAGYIIISLAGFCFTRTPPHTPAHTYTP